MKIAGQARSPRKRARPRDRRSAVHRRSGRAASRAPACLAGVGAARARTWCTRLDARGGAGRSREWSTTPDARRMFRARRYRSSRHDEPLFPSEVMYHQQPVAWVLGETLEAAQRGAARVEVEYQPLPAILTIEKAIAAGKLPLRAACACTRGRRARRPSPRSPHRIEGEVVASAARNISIWKRNTRWRGWTKPAALRCIPPRSIPARRRRSWRACSVFRGTR